MEYGAAADAAIPHLTAPPVLADRVAILDSADSEERQCIALALARVEDGDIDGALGLLGTGNAALTIRGHLLRSRSRWDEIRPSATDSAAALLRSFAEAPRESRTWTDSVGGVALSLSRSGSPVIRAGFDGTEVDAWVDTGAGMTVVSSTLADRLGIKPLTAVVASAGTATSSRVGIRPAIVRQLTIGPLTVENHPVLIIDSRDLQVRLFGFAVVSIEAIIGWNLLQHLETELAPEARAMSVRRPSLSAEPATADTRNLVWLAQPMVKVRGPGGESLLFLLDTGAGSSALTPRFVTTTGVRTEGTRRVRVGGAGGSQTIVAAVVPLARLELAGQVVQLRNVVARPQAEDALVQLDGVLGFDIVHGSRRLHIDGPRGVLSLLP